MALISIPTSVGGVNIPGAVLTKGPLAALFKGTAPQYLKYPRDLENSTRSHVVMFQINEIEETKMEEATKKGIGAVDSTVNQIQAAAGNVKETVSNGVTSVGNTVKNGFESVKQFYAMPSMLAETLTTTGKAIYKSLQNFTTQKTIPKGSIALYMPDNFSLAYSSNYDDNTTLASAAGALPVVGGIASSITGVMENNDAAKLALNKMGYVFNPQKQLLFQGIDFRTFEMTFTFTPFSRAEAQTVKEIIQKFRMYAAPTIIEEGAGMFFKPPAIFDIQFLFNGKPNTNLPKLKKCVIESVDINYAPNGWASHTDGAPVQTTMTLQIKEIVLVDSKAIEGGA